MLWSSITYHSLQSDEGTKSGCVSFGGSRELCDDMTEPVGFVGVPGERDDEESNRTEGKVETILRVKLRSSEVVVLS